MMALSGVRSSCDMLARNSLLCRLAVSSSRLLLLDFAEQSRVLDRQRRLRRERLHEIDHLGGEVARGACD